MCVDLMSILFVTCFRRRDNSETHVKHELKGVKKRLKKRTLLSYPLSYMILSELMWSMYSVAMFLNCALSCYFSIFRLSEYGILTLERV